jgi:hypothetical protein
MPTYHGEMRLTSNNWKVNDYELQPSDQIPDPRYFRAIWQSYSWLNNALEQY